MFFLLIIILTIKVDLPIYVLNHFCAAQILCYRRPANDEIKTPRVDNCVGSEMIYFDCKQDDVEDTLILTH